MKAAKPLRNNPPVRFSVLARKDSPASSLRGPFSTHNHIVDGHEDRPRGDVLSIGQPRGFHVKVIGFPVLMHGFNPKALSVPC